MGSCLRNNIKGPLGGSASGMLGENSHKMSENIFDKKYKINIMVLCGLYMRYYPPFLPL